MYHPKKPKKIRAVFNSSAQYDGISLNSVLLTGPDLNNTLLGVLMRFRKEAIAFTADVEQIFYCFLVRENDLKDLDLNADTSPLQCSLGLDWNLKTDCFLFNVSSETKQYTQQGVLATINSLYDLLGFVAPVTVQGKAILRELTAKNGNWDVSLPPAMEDAWTSWRAFLSELAELSIPRQYTEASPSAAVRRELCVFCDASVKAVAPVCYLKVTDSNGNNQVGFVMGKAKLAPRPEHTVPRLVRSSACC